MRVEISMKDAGLATFIRKSESLTRANVEIARGLNEAGDRVRTIVRHRLQHQMNVLRYGVITDETASGQASPGHLTYMILGTGKGLPIRDFPVHAARGGPVVADRWGVPHVFARSFMTLYGKLRARRGAARMPIRALGGPAVSKEIVKGETLDAFEAWVGALVRPACHGPPHAVRVCVGLCSLRMMLDLDPAAGLALTAGPPEGGGGHARPKQLDNPLVDLRKISVDHLLVDATSVPAVKRLSKSRALMLQNDGPPRDHQDTRREADG